MQGRKVNVEPHLYQNGDYGLWHGTWYAKSPTGQLANLGGHMVVENIDGTITVSPSILVGSDYHGRWHGYLKNGVWQEC